MEESQGMHMWAFLGKVTKRGRGGKEGDRKKGNGSEDTQGREGEWERGKAG